MLSWWMGTLYASLLLCSSVIARARANRVRATASSNTPRVSVHEIQYIQCSTHRYNCKGNSLNDVINIIACINDLLYTYILYTYTNTHSVSITLVVNYDSDCQYPFPLVGHLRSTILAGHLCLTIVALSPHL